MNNSTYKICKVTIKRQELLRYQSSCLFIWVNSVVTVTPKLIAVEIEYDKNNPKKILETLFFQSNYFTNPKKLYIKGSSIKALDKDKLKVIVNVDEKTLLKAPDNKLTLTSVTNLEGKISLEFGLLKDKIMDEKRGYFVFQSGFEDSNGKLFDEKTSGAYCHMGGTKDGIGFSITSDSKFKNPIYLTITDYPSRIKGDFKVEIK